MSTAEPGPAGYPPPDHVLRDLPFDLEATGERTSTARLAIGDQVLDAGVVAVGPVLTVVDVLAGTLVGRVLAPDWMATAQLSLHLGPMPPAGVLRADGEVLRAGRTTVVTEVALHAETPDRPVPVGEATLTFVRLPRRDTTPDLSAEAVRYGERFRFDRRVDRPPPPFAAGIGLCVLDAAAGAVEAPVTPYVRNSFGAVNGGVVASVAEAAAAVLAADRLGARCRSTDVVAHYLAQGRLGPLRTRARVVRGDGTEVLTRVEVLDHGAASDGPSRLLVAHLRCVPA